MNNIAICDDMPEICTQIDEYIQEYCKEHNEKLTVYSVNDAKTLYEVLKKEKIDLLFLDIELPDKNGLEIGKYIRNKIQDDDMQIVYISAIKDYSMELFQIRPNNFLIKPIRKEQVVEDLKTAIKLTDKKEKIFRYSINKDEFKQKISDIIYFESKRRKIIMITEYGEIDFYDSLKNIYNELKNYSFSMCHNSYLVNLNKIIRFSKSTITMSNKTKINISRSKREEFINSISENDLY